jgi:MFS family permease
MFQRNIRLMYIIGSLMWGRFFIPVIALFYVASQVPLEQFAIIMGVFSLSILLLEVPSGVIADLLGKKRTLLLSRGLYLVEIVLLATQSGFWPLLIAKIISGVGVSLSSGTDSSLLFDTLKKLKRTSEHKKISGKKQMYAQFSQAFTFIIGAYLFTVHPKLPAYLSLIPLLVGFILTFYLKEPYPPKSTLTFSSSCAHLKKGVNLFFKNQTLLFLVLFGFPLAFVIEMSLSFSSSFLEQILIPVSLIGVVAFVGSFLMGVGSKYAYALDRFFGSKKTFLFLALALFVCMVFQALSLLYIGVIFYIAIMFLAGIKGVLINHQAQEKVTQKHRSTMISIMNLCNNAGIFFIYLLVSAIIRQTSLQVAYVVISALLAVGLLVVFVYYQKMKKKIVFVS